MSANNISYLGCLVNLSELVSEGPPERFSPMAEIEEIEKQADKELLRAKQHRCNLQFKMNELTGTSVHAVFPELCFEKVNHWNKNATTAMSKVHTAAEKILMIKIAHKV